MENIQLPLDDYTPAWRVVAVAQGFTPGGSNVSHWKGTFHANTIEEACQVALKELKRDLLDDEWGAWTRLALEVNVA
jgi:hypothetical protein